jgi:hypothetical protein
MDSAPEPAVITTLPRLNAKGPDDIFICCAGFEERSLASPALMGPQFIQKYAIIFNVEAPDYKKQVEKNMFRLQVELRKKTTEGIFVVTSTRENPVDGIQQIGAILKQCKLNPEPGPYVTVDISSFTKIYLLELLHYLDAGLRWPMPRLLHTTQKYLPTRLTRGVEQITTIPHFYGHPSMDRESLLVLLLGFEPDRALSIWKQHNPARTVALITNPPRRGSPDYLKYARQNNEELLSKPGVQVRDIPADDPAGVRDVLETLYEETKDDCNMVVGPFGTKPQVVGVYLFHRNHAAVQVIYSFPAAYTRSYLQRQPGETMLLPALRW